MQKWEIGIWIEESKESRGKNNKSGNNKAEREINIKNYWWLKEISCGGLVNWYSFVLVPAKRGTN